MVTKIKIYSWYRIPEIGWRLTFWGKEWEISEVLMDGMAVEAFRWVAVDGSETRVIPDVCVIEHACRQWPNTAGYIEAELMPPMPTQAVRTRVAVAPWSRRGLFQLKGPNAYFSSRSS